MILFSRQIASLLGLNAHEPLLFVGINLVAFAAILVGIMTRSRIPVRLCWIVVMADLAWVIGSALGPLVLPHNLSSLGLFLIVDVACVVGTFAGLQAFYLRRFTIEASALQGA